MYMYMVWSSHIAREYMDPPGKVVNPVRGQPNRENQYSPVPVRACLLRIWSRETGFTVSPVPRQPGYLQ